MVGCVLSQLKPSLLPSTFLALKNTYFKAKNVEILGLYPIHNGGRIQDAKKVNMGVSPQDYY